MSYVRIIALSALILGLWGCSGHHYDYLRESQTARPIVVPPNVKVKPSENYYPVPNGVNHSESRSPSMEPPGSDLQRFRSAKQNAQSANNIASQLPAAETTQAVNINAPETLTLSMNVNQAWAKVGNALHHTPYQIMDQDSSMSSYYILDVVSTDNRITKATPIYRVYLKGEGDKTEVSLLDQGNQPAASIVAKRIMLALQQKLV